jgi:hypothetical protein
MLRSMLGRAQNRAAELSEKELRLAAVCAALFVIAALALTHLVFGWLPGKTLFGYRRYYAAVMALATLPLLPGLIVGGGIGELVTYFGGHHETAVYWTSTLVGAWVNWYLYFLLFANFIRWRKKRKLPRPAEGAR